MTNVLLLSNNEIFREDMANQIEHHLTDFKVFADKQNDVMDMIIIDEDTELLKQQKNEEIKTPVILLTQKDIFDDIKVSQVIKKPLNLNDFLDVLKSSINIFERSEEGVLEFNEYALYPSLKRIVNKRTNSETKLTEKEVAVIKYLYKNKDLVVSKNELIKEVWEYAADVATHTVETHIYRLRQKVEQGDVGAQLINTIDGGYRLNI